MGNASFLTPFLETENYFSKSCQISAIGLTKYTNILWKNPLGDPLILLPNEKVKMFVVNDGEIRVFTSSHSVTQQEKKIERRPLKPMTLYPFRQCKWNHPACLSRRNCSVRRAIDPHTFFCGDLVMKYFYAVSSCSSSFANERRTLVSF